MGFSSTRSAPSSALIRQELEAIIRSEIFCHSIRQTQLLEYLCTKVLLGEGDQIKATTIAMEVFRRSADFDESKDAVVRVEAHRLRKKLSRYYAEQGAHDRVRIVLTPGSYVPEFLAAAEDPAAGAASATPAEPPLEPVLSDDSGHAGGKVTVSAFRQDGWLAYRWFAVLALALAVMVGVSVLLRRWVRRKNAEPVAAVGAVAAGAGPEIRILAGRANGYVDRVGRTWGPDRFFEGGSAQPGPKEFFGKPPDSGLFGSMRAGEFTYHIPAGPGSYELRLYWAEPVFRGQNEDAGTGENERRFHVILNGKPLLSSFDVSADSGLAPVDIRAFKDVRPAADGKVHLKFTAAYGTPFLNGLELLPAPGGRTVPVRFRAHMLSFSDRLGVQWGPDDYFVGGRLATHKQAVEGTLDPELYAGERYGNFSYFIPEPPGRYVVTLYFAETWFRPDIDGDNHGGPGSRIFDVYSAGATLLKGFDMLAETRPFRAIVRTFRNVQPNGQGKIAIFFSPSRNYASVKAIEVTDEP